MRIEVKCNTFVINMLYLSHKSTIQCTLCRMFNDFWNFVLASRYSRITNYKWILTLNSSLCCWTLLICEWNLWINGITINDSKWLESLSFGSDWRHCDIDQSGSQINASAVACAYGAVGPVRPPMFDILLITYNNNFILYIMHFNNSEQLVSISWMLYFSHMHYIYIDI